MTAALATVLLVAAAALIGAGLRRARGGEPWLALGTVALIADTFVIQRARVLTIPFFMVFVMILLFWSARRSAEREE
jgi:hypothetical protein